MYISDSSSVINISLMLGSGCVSTMIFEFTSRRSTHIRILPFGFLATTIGETHFEASIGSMIPPFCKRCISSDSAGCTDRGMLRTLCCTGVASSRHCIRCVKCFAGTLLLWSNTSSNSSTTDGVVCRTGCIWAGSRIILSFACVGQPNVVAPCIDT